MPLDTDTCKRNKDNIDETNENIAKYMNWLNVSSTDNVNVICKCTKKMRHDNHLNIEWLRYVSY